MNKVILDSYQLNILRQFIVARGIKEADLVEEILDHFACKVEEVMSVNPYLSFERAIGKAYLSFGYGGLDTIAKNYSHQLQKKIGHQYLLSWGKVIGSKAILPNIIICIFLLMLHLYNKRLLTENVRITEWVFYSCFFGIFIYLLIDFYLFFFGPNSLFELKANKDAKLWQKKVVQLPKPNLLILLMLFTQPYLKSDTNLFLISMIFVSLFQIICTLVIKDVFKKTAELAQKPIAYE